MDPDKSQVKVSGYLEKKGKMKMMSSYKKYWFVLEGRLLLYYRSKDEYEAISPCKGSINLGPPCTVKPCSSNLGVFQIEMRTNNVTLRAANVEDQNRWMQAIMSALNQNQSPAKLSHFRYSLDDINKASVRQDREKVTRKSLNAKRSSHGSLIQKLQKMGAQTYGGSLGSIYRLANTLGNANQSTSVASAPSDVLVENDQYGIIKSSSTGSVEIRKIECKSDENLYERLSQYSKSSTENLENPYSVPNHQSRNNSPRERQRTILFDNDDYCSVDKIVTFPNTDSEVIYAEPKYCEKIDHNKNSVSNNEAEYSTANKNIYECLKNEYSEPKELNEETSSQSSASDKHKKNTFKSMISKKMGFKDRTKTSIKPVKPLKKSRSFIQRVLKRNKPSKVDETDEDIYEIVLENDVEKVAVSDSSTVQMLSELHNILEQKKPLLMKLSQSEEIPQPSSITNAVEEETLNNVDEQIYSSSSSDRPNLPQKKHSKTMEPSPYHDYPKNHSPIAQSDAKDSKSIDEILDDLDKETGKAKMQKLIKKFSRENIETKSKEADTDSDSEEVVLRQHYTNEPENSSRYSDELTRLLDELVKVTSAPILTAGLTMSLINPYLSDDEILQLIPIRKRRRSDPDYDVPRPHKSLMNLHRKDLANVMPSTRFFGVQVPNCGKIAKHTEVDNSTLCFSITPDSLEPDVQLSKRNMLTAPPSSCFDDRNLSYTSHNYIEITGKDLLLHRKSLDWNDDYAHPKMHRSSADAYIIQRPQIFKAVKNVDISADDVFVDSLEFCSELSTIF